MVLSLTESLARLELEQEEEDEDDLYTELLPLESEFSLSATRFCSSEPPRGLVEVATLA